MTDLLPAMVGRWLLCGHESVFAVDGGDIGLEITADQHWYKLFTAQGAATIRGAGFDEEGTWTALDLGDHLQVNFSCARRCGRCQTRAASQLLSVLPEGTHLCQPRMPTNARFT